MNKGRGSNTLTAGLLILAGILAGCNGEGQDHAASGALARAYGHYLYLDDIDGYQIGMDPADSVNIVNKAVEDWLIGQIVAEKARTQLPSSEKKEIDRKVDAYRDEMYMFAFEKIVARQKMDTVIQDSLIRSYYDHYIARYKLEEPLIRFAYVKCDEASYLEEAESWIRDSLDLHSLEDFCSEELLECHLSPQTWVPMRKFDEKLGEIGVNQQRIRSGDPYLRKKVDNTFYLLRILGFLDKGDPAPIEYVRKDIHSILMNKRRAEFLTQFHQEVMINESVKGNIKIFDHE